MAKPIYHSSIEGAQHGGKGLEGFLAFAKEQILDARMQWLNTRDLHIVVGYRALVVPLPEAQPRFVGSHLTGGSKDRRIRRPLRSDGPQIHIAEHGPGDRRSTPSGIRAREEADLVDSIGDQRQRRRAPVRRALTIACRSNCPTPVLPCSRPLTITRQGPSHRIAGPDFELRVLDLHDLSMGDSSQQE